MIGHGFVWALGATLVLVSASARSPREKPTAPIHEPAVERRQEFVVSADPPPDPIPNDVEPARAIDERDDRVLRSLGVLKIRLIDDNGVQEFTLATTPLSESQQTLLEFWKSWRKQSIDALPEDLRTDSDHRKAIDEAYRSGLGELASVGDDSESRVRDGGRTGDFWDSELMEVLYRPVPEPDLLVLDSWADWRARAIFALPEGLREDSDYRKAIDAQHDAATRDIEERRNAQEWNDLHEKLRQVGHIKSD